MEKSWHSFRSTKIKARFWIMFSCTVYELVNGGTNLDTLFKHYFTHLLSKLGESHGNQRRELLRYLDTKG
jgi:hypothetical protein